MTMHVLLDHQLDCWLLSLCAGLWVKMRFVKPLWIKHGELL
jgi:hypothetical protein